MKSIKALLIVLLAAGTFGLAAAPVSVDGVLLFEPDPDLEQELVDAGITDFGT